MNQLEAAENFDRDSLVDVLVRYAYTQEQMDAGH